MDGVRVIIPWQGGCPHREAALEWVRARWAELGVWPVVSSIDGPWVKAAAVTPAVEMSAADIVVIADADVWCDGVGAAVDAVRAGAGWAVPHTLVHRLSRESTHALLTDSRDDWRGLPLSTDNAQDRRPYVGRAGGGIVVLKRSTYLDVPIDSRFVGWAREDECWSIALHNLVGRPRRGGADLVHLWHPPQPRPNRVQGSAETEALYRRYLRCRSASEVRQLVDEHKERRPVG